MGRPTKALPQHTRAWILDGTRRCLNAGLAEWPLDLGIDLVVGHREGCFLFDVDRGPYLDAVCDGTTFNLGHRHPRLLARLKEGLGSLDTGCQFLPSSARVELAQELLDTVPSSLSLVQFASTASEANAVALQAARAATGREAIVSVRGSAHELLGATPAAAPAERTRSSERAWQQVPWNDLEALAAALQRRDVAALIIEPLPPELGWPLPAAGYHAGVRELCSAAGTLLIVDETCTGLGRTGKLWAFEHWQQPPDVLVMANGAGGGLYPLAYCLMNAAAASWTRTRPFSVLSTLAGSELGCLLGTEVLRITTEPQFLRHVAASAAHLAAGLRLLAAQFPAQLLEVRQLGLAAALRFADPHGGALMMPALFRHHVWARAAVFDLSVLQLTPPLVISRVQIDLLLTALRDAIVDCWKTPARLT